MIKAVIIDDELSAANVLQLMLERHVPQKIEIRIATKTMEAEALLTSFKPDLVFLDIVMPEKNGFEFLSDLRQTDFEIIFTTAFDEFAIKAIRFSALDYLLKPIDAEELKNAVTRFFKKAAMLQQSNALFQNLIQNLEKKQETEYKLAIPTISGVLFFETANILRLEGVGNYTQFYLTDNKKYLSSKTLKEYEELLKDHGFLRIHKSHLINRNFIDGYLNEGMVRLKDKSVLPVSRQRKQTVIASLKGRE